MTLYKDCLHSSELSSCSRDVFKTLKSTNVIRKAYIWVISKVSSIQLYTLFMRFSNKYLQTILFLHVCYFSSVLFQKPNNTRQRVQTMALLHNFLRTSYSFIHTPQHFSLEQTVAKALYKPYLYWGDVVVDSSAPLSV
jgi:hypothetical protein